MSSVGEGFNTKKHAVKLIQKANYSTPIFRSTSI